MSMLNRLFILLLILPLCACSVKNKIAQDSSAMLPAQSSAAENILPAGTAAPDVSATVTEVIIYPESPHSKEPQKEVFKENASHGSVTADQKETLDDSALADNTLIYDPAGKNSFKEDSVYIEDPSSATPQENLPKAVAGETIQEALPVVVDDSFSAADDAARRELPGRGSLVLGGAMGLLLGFLVLIRVRRQG